MASFPEKAVWTLILNKPISPSATLMLNSLSSTTRTLALGAYRVCPSAKLLLTLTSSLLPNTTGIITRKTLPCSYSLSTIIFPPIISTKVLLIESPKPVPTMVRFCSVSIRWKVLNSFGRSSLRIPMPLSLISNVSLSSEAVTLNFTYPFSVYLTAFPQIFVNTCLSLISSPYR